LANALQLVLAAGVGFLVAALTGFGNRIGALLADQVGGGRRFGREMQGVRLEIRHEWAGAQWINENDPSDPEVGMLVTGSVINGSSQQIAIATATMRHRDSGEAHGSKTIPVLPPPGEREVELRRVLGLDSDRPFPEEDEDWEDRYTFELEWSDHKGGRWRYHWNPRDSFQSWDRLPQ
jgi:hypothetical protein